jgi:UDP-N-acetylmuramoylalanine--D-glutamate ligase
MSAFAVDGARVVVIGAARSGVAAAELLSRRGARVTLTDMKPAVADAGRLRAAGVEVELGSANADAAAHADLIVLSPGVPPELPAVVMARSRGVAVIGELELAYRWVRGPVVAITGTKGKSTTTTLVGRMLEAAGRRVLVGGNIGVPLSAQVDASTEDTLHVVEASSFQLETTVTFRPYRGALELLAGPSGSPPR